MRIFVTGTDTGVGKTFFCGLLLRFLKDQGIRAGYQKWVSSGGGQLPEDLAFCLGMAGEDCDPAMLDLQVPYRLQMPASPHLAAEKEGVSIDPAVIRQRFEAMAGMYEILVVEGVGGLMVPLSRDLLLSDLLATMKLPCVVVARSGLGTLNHTLLSLEALRHRDIPLVGVVFSDAGPDQHETIVADNMQTIAAIGKVPVLGRIPWCAEPLEAVRHFDKIGRAILAQQTGLAAV